MKSHCGVSSFDIIRLISDDSSDQGSQTTSCTSLVEKALSHGADINTSIFWTYSILIARGNYISIVLEESALSYIEEYRTRMGFHSLKDISDLLRSRGALQRRRCRLISDPFERAKEDWRESFSYQLSADQSGRLLDAYDERLPIDIAEDVFNSRREAIRQVINEFKTNLNETDKVNGSTFVLRSSFDSDGGET
jgi:hypothetical protein